MDTSQCPNLISSNISLEGRTWGLLIYFLPQNNLLSAHHYGQHYFRERSVGPDLVCGISARHREVE